MYVYYADDNMLGIGKHSLGNKYCIVLHAVLVVWTEWNVQFII